MGKLDSAQNLEHSPELLKEVCREFLELHSNSQSISVGHAKAEKLMLIHGLVANTILMTRGALLLIDQNLLHAAKAQTRIALEHAVTAQWIHLHPNGVASFKAKSKEKYGRYIREASKVMDVPQDIHQAFDELPGFAQPAQGIHDFKSTCDDFVGVEWFYVIFRTLSGAIHPSNATIHDYLRTDEASSVGYSLLDTPDFKDPRPLLFTLALSCSLSVAVFEDLRKSKPNKKKIKAIAAKLQLPTLLTLKKGPSKTSK
jgi:hypothetical protein